MTQGRVRVRASDGVEEQGKWLNSPVTSHEGSLAEIDKWIPSFDRRPFELMQANAGRVRAHEHLDTIVRLPFGEDRDSVPIGVVSKDYALVTHRSILGAVLQALRSARIPPDGLRTELTITKYGERMALSVFLPQRYAFDPGDGNGMALRLECVNSVDGSTRLRALMGWFRFVCSNGLVIGITQYRVRRRHSYDLSSDNIVEVLMSGLLESEAEKRNFEQWRRTRVDPPRLDEWLEQDVKRLWGVKAATRAFHIARSGFDVEAEGQYKGPTLASIRVRKTKPVPGAPPRCSNLFDASQVLAWLAGQRRDVKEQMEWREQIPGLLDSLATSLDEDGSTDTHASLVGPQGG